MSLECMSLELQRLGAGHGPAVLAFELENRAYFAASISDRGDDWFEHFDERHAERLADQAAGRDAYYVLVEGGESGAVIGRFNLVGLDGLDSGTAELGYRVAQRATGRGVATAAVLELCQVAARQLGLHTLVARTTPGNTASRRVLEKAGFLADGTADVAGRPGLRFRRDLGTVVISAAPGADRRRPGPRPG